MTDREKIEREKDFELRMKLSDVIKKNRYFRVFTL